MARHTKVRDSSVMVIISGETDTLGRKLLVYFTLLLGGCLPLCQRFRKFRSEIKWKGPFRFLPTGIFGITSGGGPLISVGIFRPKFAVPFLTNRFFALIREFRKGIKSGKSHSYWLARFNRKMFFLRYSHLSLTGRFGIMGSTLCNALTSSFNGSQISEATP